MKVELVDEGAHGCHFIAITPNYEIDMVELCHYLWYQPNQEVNTFSVLEP
jgi:hypothetical protein